MTRNPSGLAKALSSLACLVGARDGLERSSECVGVRCRGDLSQPVAATIWHSDTPLCAWLAACGHAVASRSSRLVGRHQPEVHNRCAANSAVCRWSLAQIIRRMAFVSRLMPARRHKGSRPAGVVVQQLVSRRELQAARRVGEAVPSHARNLETRCERSRTLTNAPLLTCPNATHHSVSAAGGSG